MVGRFLLRLLLKRPYAHEVVESFYGGIEKRNTPAIAKLVFEVLDSVEDDHVDKREIRRLKEKAYSLLLDFGLDAGEREKS